MSTFWRRLALPASVVVLLSGAVTALLLSRPFSGSLETRLAALAQSPDPAEDVKAIDRLIGFQVQAVRAELGSPEAQPMADLYFQAAEILNGRNDSSLQDLAIEYYAKSAALYPALRHGYLLFNQAELLLKKNRPAEARELYRRVSLYDFDDLALRARYRAELAALWQGRPVDPYPLYAYLRYGNSGGLSSLEPFASAEFEPRPEARLLRALMRKQTGAPDFAEAELDSYFQLRPLDYAARYYRDLPRDTTESTRYPSDGNLLPEAYVLRAERNGETVRLREEGRLRADFYCTSSLPALELELVLDSLSPDPDRVEVKLNGKPVATVATEEALKIHRFPVSPTVGKNLLELRLVRAPESASREAEWVEVRTLRLVPPAGEPDL